MHLRLSSRNKKNKDVSHRLLFCLLLIWATRYLRDLQFSHAIAPMYVYKIIQNRRESRFLFNVTCHGRKTDAVINIRSQNEQRECELRLLHPTEVIG